MTSAQFHAILRARLRAHATPGTPVASGRIMNMMRTLAAALAAASAIVAGCAGKPDLIAPQVLVAPGAGSDRPQIWAVAPLANESGTSAVDALMVTDAIVARAAEARGLAVLPLNRTLAAMRALRMNAVRSAGDARQLAAALGADAIVVGSITAYDPYDPPTIGLMLGLYAPGQSGTSGLDASALQRQASDATASRSPGFDPDAPRVVISEHLDAHNHEVLMNLRRYAEGRHDPKAALGWRQYTASMELFTEFAAYWSVYRLLQEERLAAPRPTVARTSAAR